MKVIIAGGRMGVSYDEVVAAIKASGFEITEVVSGCAAGVDTHGEQWAAENHIPVVKFPADWQKYDRSAGPIRNSEMAEYADALIAIWDGGSRGTANMIGEMKAKSKAIFIKGI